MLKIYIPIYFTGGILSTSFYFHKFKHNNIKGDIDFTSRILGIIWPISLPFLFTYSIMGILNNDKIKK